MFRKSSKVSPPKAKAPVPREMSVLETENQRLCMQAGQLQYQIHVLKSDLENINRTLKDLNYEAAARQKLDKESAKPEEVSDVTGA